MRPQDPAPTEPRSTSRTRTRKSPRSYGTALRRTLTLSITATVFGLSVISPASSTQAKPDEPKEQPPVETPAETLPDGTDVVAGLSARLPEDVANSCRMLKAEHTDRSLREMLSLDPTPPKTSNLVEAYGIEVSADEAEFLNRAAAVSEGINEYELIDAAADIFDDSYVGITFDSAGFYRVHYLADRLDSKTAPTRLRELGTKFGFADNEMVLTSVTRGVESETAYANYKTLNDAAAELSEAGDVVEFSLDESCGLVAVYANKDSVGKATETLSKLLDPGEFVVLPIQDFEQTRPADRTSSHNPYLGGAAVRLTPGSATAMNCTTNIGWYKGHGSNREWWGVTAAHCLPNQTWYSAGSFATVNMNWYQGADIDINSSGPSTTYFVYGGQMDMAVVQLDRSAVKTTITQDPLVGPEIRLDLDWWHWSPTMDQPKGTVPGHTMCHSGKTSNFVRCGELLTRTYTILYTSSQSKIGVAVYLHHVHRVSTGVLGGDSGGTVWHDQGPGGDDNLVGVVHGGHSTRMNYTHISYLKSIFGLTAPAGMS